MYFKIVISGQSVVPFLYTHTVKIGSAGCALDAQLEDCIVTFWIPRVSQGWTFSATWTWRTNNSWNHPMRSKCGRPYVAQLGPGPAGTARPSLPGRGLTGGPGIFYPGGCDIKRF